VPAPPRLRVLPARGPVRAVVLVLHGGRESSRERVRPWHASVLRMIPLARAIHRATARDGVAVWFLRYRVRGWNGAAQSPVADARWALEEAGRRHGDVPVVAVGHSMGGRTALRVAGGRSVVGVVALAPWLPPGEPAGEVRGRRVLLVHGTADTWTDPQGSRDFAARARSLARDLSLVEIPGAGHFMLRRLRRWHGLTVTFTRHVLASALGGPLTGPAS
jgi:alpha-beta hydrolase superfamily lysophospholipase